MKLKVQEKSDHGIDFKLGNGGDKNMRKDKMQKIGDSGQDAQRFMVEWKTKVKNTQIIRP